MDSDQERALRHIIYIKDQLEEICKVWLDSVIEKKRDKKLNFSTYTLPFFLGI